jgi:hypothetical protein
MGVAVAVSNAGASGLPVERFAVPARNALHLQSVVPTRAPAAAQKKSAKSRTLLTNAERKFLWP